jgi:hypothetical protein
MKKILIAILALFAVALTVGAAQSLSTPAAPAPTLETVKDCPETTS